MNVLATFSDPDAAAVLEGLLAKRSIAFQRRTSQEESGLEAIDVMVPESQYEAACDVAEQWVAACEAAYEARTTRRCPRCNCPRIDPVPEVEGVFKCRDCGHLM